ncbi:MAG TPA: hypothetical protein DCS12_09545, partial [Clostridiales bacterium]|nr:hypothetical protein [Clostridiales bacterium]
MNNYRNNMPHYDSLPHNYNPMGINEHKNSNRMHLANTMPRMPGMPDDMLQRPFIPETEMPLEIDGDMPALPRFPQQGIPSLIPPWLTQPEIPMMPGMQPTPGMPGMPQMPGMQPTPGMPGMPQMPGMQPTPGMPGMPQMPGM